MARIGFVGLGSMGAAMAQRLVDAGNEVVVWNRSPGAASRLVENGATEAGSVEEAMATGLVFSMLANEAAVFDVFGESALAAAPAGALHVNMATVSPQAAGRLGELHRDAGVDYVAAPVVGRPTAAEQGLLSILMAGEASALERATPHLTHLGRRLWNFGTEPGDANVVKIAVNYLIIHALQGISESVSLLEGSGIDGSRFIELLGDSIFPGPVYAGYGSAIVDRRYTPPGFTTTLGLKDLRLAADVGTATGTVLPTADVLKSVFEDALAAGQGGLDWASIAEVTRVRSGRA